MKRRFGKRAFAAFMSAAMILSASTEIAFAKANSVTDQSAISEVSDASSVSAASTEQSQGGASIVAAGYRTP